MVYGKDRVGCTPRFKRLLLDYEVRNTFLLDALDFPDCLLQNILKVHHPDELWERQFGETGTPYDVFEPDYIKRALIRDDLGLGPLIFGQVHWEKISPFLSLGVAEPNPLTSYFSAPECMSMI
jgi:hypothetical protein